MCTGGLVSNTVIRVGRVSGSSRGGSRLGFGLFCSGNKYQSVEIPAFWQSPVYIYPSTVKAGLPQKPPLDTEPSKPAHFHYSTMCKQREREQEGKKWYPHWQRCRRKNFTRVNNMGNRPGSSSHNMLNSAAKGGKWTLISTKELLLNDGYSAQFQFWHAKAVWGTQLLGSGMWAGVVGLFTLLVLHGLSPAGL